MKRSGGSWTLNREQWYTAVSLPSAKEKCFRANARKRGYAHLDKNWVHQWRGWWERSRVAAAMYRCRGSMSSSPFQLAGVGQVWYPQVFTVVPSVVVPYVSTSFHWGQTESLRGQVPLQSIPPLPFPPRYRHRRNQHDACPAARSFPCSMPCLCPLCPPKF